MGRKKLPITGPPSFPIKRGCKKFPHLIGAVSIRAGDLSALSHNRAEVPLLQYRPLPPLEMTIAAGSIQSFQRGTQIEKMLHRIRHFDESGAEWRNLTP